MKRIILFIVIFLSGVMIFSENSLTYIPCRYPATEQELRITQPYGFDKNPFTGLIYFHGGIGLVTSDANVTSAAKGIVVEIAEDTILGKYIRIDHFNGFVSQYSRLNDIYSAKGEIVNQGQIIGIIGTTGNATGPHVQFEVWFFGVRINPELAIVLEAEYLSRHTIEELKSLLIRNSEITEEYRDDIGDADNFAFIDGEMIYFSDPSFLMSIPDAGFQFSTENSEISTASGLMIGDSIETIIDAYALPRHIQTERIFSTSLIRQYFRCSEIMENIGPFQLNYQRIFSIDDCFYRLKQQFQIENGVIVRIDYMFDAYKERYF